MKRYNIGIMAALAFAAFLNMTDAAQAGGLKRVLTPLWIYGSQAECQQEQANDQATCNQNAKTNCGANGVSNVFFVPCSQTTGIDPNGDPVTQWTSYCDWVCN